MVMHKRIAWLVLLVIAAASITIIVATRHSSGEASVQQQVTRIKILRRKDRLHLKPTMQEIQDTQPPPEERFLEDQIPKHLPIKIKIKEVKQKAFKDLKNDKWARDFELEVTNTGDKPIYYLSLVLITDVIAARGYRIVFPLSFGRTELSEIRIKAEPADISMKPGETIVLRIHPGQLEGYTARQREEKRPHPRKIQVNFQGLSFGDGTGYGPGGISLPRKVDTQSILNRCVDQPNRGDPTAMNPNDLCASA